MRKRIRAAWSAFLRPELLEIRDPLTGALMPKEFSRLANRIIYRAQKGGQIISLAYIDADGLKGVNDTWGHKAGDFLIKELARAILTNLRPFDVCARQYGEGGDEFVILLPGASLNDAEKVVKRIQREYPHFSWGVTQLRDEEDSIECMVERAERLMYCQKKEKK